MEEGKTGWDDDILRDICNDKYASLIKKIQLSMSTGQDS